ncbi:hypothetical protein C6P42_004429 [Pichia californica]|nr:hypothetical protein C6P42_004429 [[Candida] californica]
MYCIFKTVYILFGQPFTVENKKPILMSIMKMYKCDFKDCQREFTRSDHLKRHKVNHTSKRIKCSEPNCSMVFTRMDIKKKHERRHHKNLFNTQEDNINKITKNTINNFKPIPSPMTSLPNLDVEIPDMKDEYLSDVLKWLLDSEQTFKQDQTTFNNSHLEEKQLGFNASILLEDLLALSPEFPTENFQTEIDENLRFEMIKFIPLLELNPDFTIPKIKYFLQLYWLLYHSQYPILHRPSFSTFQVHPLLLLSMIMIGSSFTHKATNPNHLNLIDTKGLSLLIAEPLRWCIFANKNSKPPCQIWVIQALIILETFEVSCSTRSLHERSFIYSNVKIQLLRRTPILGGDPLKDGKNIDNSKISIWNSWIEAECIKRAAFMSFHMNTIHAVVFGHSISLNVNQLKLSLPCPDHIWEYNINNNNINNNNNNNNKENEIIINNSPLFVESLQKLLNYIPIETGTFGRSILLSGLMNLALQVEQNIQQWSNLGWKGFKDGWKDRFSNAIEFWKSQLPNNGNCLITSSSIYYINSSLSPLPISLLSEDSICKFCVYHSFQINLKIPHYDYIVFAGAPKRMNVPISQEDYDIVVNRIDCWCGSINGKEAVVNSLIFLCEILIPGGIISYNYDPTIDPLIYRPSIVVCSTLVLWTYTFHKFGVNMENNRKEEETENGYDYLRRVHEGLRNVTRKKVSLFKLNNLEMNEKMDVLKEYYLGLDSIKGLNRNNGLLRMLADKFKKCDWEIGVEYSRLLENCIRRSNGSNNVFCTDMYI